MKISADHFALLFKDSAWRRVTFFGTLDNLKEKYPYQAHCKIWSGAKNVCKYLET